MTRLRSRLERYRNNPKSVTFHELKSLLEAFGFEVNNYSGGSHYSVSHPEYDIIPTMEPNTIPMRKPTLLEVYVRRSLRWIEKVIEIQETEEAVKNNETKGSNS